MRVGFCLPSRFLAGKRIRYEGHDEYPRVIDEGPPETYTADFIADVRVGRPADYMGGIREFIRRTNRACMCSRRA